ncbi:hypothetical protein ACHAW5_010134 [Stephanodiscus triporus]|uniref:Uncharacterized protein n=1 Tax=Stephanodiscus triporus TaxID=2934178 RepID=A0ABD3MYJ2_9STRA
MTSDHEQNSPESIISPPEGCGDEDLLRLIDLCPFLASEKSRYDDVAVLSILRRNPRAACLRRPYRCGIGNGPDGAHPLALVVALGGSLEVVRRMVDSCPSALGMRLGGRRNVLHYAIAEGVDVSVISYLTSRRPALAIEEDSFGAIPLHLASTYCPSSSSSSSVIVHLLSLNPDAAGALDRKSQTPLHRACMSRASLDDVLALIEACPDALFLDDWLGNRPLEYAESMHQRLSEPIPEVIEVLGMAEEILGAKEEDDDDDDDDDDASGDEVGGRRCRRVLGGARKDRTRRILAHFVDIRWRGGVRLAFARNPDLASILDLPPGVFPRLLCLLGTEGVYSVLVRCTDVVFGFA